MYRFGEGGDANDHTGEKEKPLAVKNDLVARPTVWQKKEGKGLKVRIHFPPPSRPFIKSWRGKRSGGTSDRLVFRTGIFTNGNGRTEKSRENIIEAFADFFHFRIKCEQRPVLLLQKVREI